MRGDLSSHIKLRVASVLSPEWQSLPEGVVVPEPWLRRLEAMPIPLLFAFLVTSQDGGVTFVEPMRVSALVEGRYFPENAVLLHPGDAFRCCAPP